MNRIILILCAVFVVGACGEEERVPEHYTLTFSAQDDRGEPLAGVPILVGETSMGQTGSDGTLIAEVTAHDGDRYPLAAPCPSPHDDAEVPSEVLFLGTRGLGGDKNARLEIRILCSRRSRVAALLVHAEGRAGIPILVDGVERGKTGPEGFAHLRLEGSAHEQFQVALDTSAYPTLVPKDPRHEVQLGDADALFVFQPQLTVAEPPAKPKRKRRRRRKLKAPEAPKRPVRIN